MGKYRYGVVFDAGSSGTRLHVYRWKNTAAARNKADAEDLSRLPQVSTKKSWTEKKKPGISTFADHPHSVGPDYLKSLLDRALEIVPADEIERTPVFLLATAGVRLLEKHQREALLAEVCAYAKMNYKFQLPDCGIHVQAISGETEGLYGWLSANYLLEAFDRPRNHAHGKGHNTYGFLDLGGASAQIAFAPNSTEAEKHGNDLNLLRLRTLDGKSQEHRVFVTTYLGYGVNEARRRYLEDLQEHHVTDKELPDPCLPKGMSKKIDIIGKASQVVGTGAFDECLRRTYPLLEKDAKCDDPPCLFHGIHVPALDFEVNHFVGVSEYWHTTHEIFEMGFGDNAYNFQKYQQLVQDFCSQDWNTIQKGVASHQWGKKVDEEKATDVCFKASWLLNMLHDGIGIPRLPSKEDPNAADKANKELAKQGYLAPFRAVNKIQDVEVSWTLGKMVLFAASQIPSASEADLAVGFGSNVAGIPPDFNYAGGKPEPIRMPTDTTEPSNSDLDSDAEDDWSSTLLDSKSYSRRTPGILLIACILVIVLFLLMGRDRRSAILNKINPFSRTSRSGRPQLRRSSPLSKLAARLPFGLGTRLAEKSRYDRLEAGELDDPMSYELGAVSSSNSSEDGDNGRNGGRKRFPGTPGVASRTSSPRTAAFSPTSTSGVGLRGAGGSGYFGTLPDGLGLSNVRTESRERVREAGIGVGTGIRSRGQSPSSRLRSPLFTPYKESVD